MSHLRRKLGDEFSRITYRLLHSLTTYLYLSTLLCKSNFSHSDTLVPKFGTNVVTNDDRWMVLYFLFFSFNRNFIFITKLGEFYSFNSKRLTFIRVFYISGQSNTANCTFNIGNNAQSEFNCRKELFVNRINRMTVKYSSTRLSGNMCLLFET